MDAILLLAAKSLIIAGGALVLLRLMKNRSAADRSWIAHLALGSLLLLPIAAWAMPSYDVEGPAFLVENVPPLTLPDTASLRPVQADPVNPTAVVPPPTNVEPATMRLPELAWFQWGYALPAALLIALTLLALGRLFVLKSRATVLIEPHWLTALARAQQRMGFKHGTALLTSDELPSPISWGVVRPVILLNRDAANSRDEAEAIITHELAHVARLDWAKLMISRLAVAFFWFNPLVWLLAREAHQLREEAADDAVLAADIEDTEYAKLLVGVARHECRGLLIGAHGVAPGRNSLSRRIRRVLDGAVKRAPGGWRWTSAAGFFAAGMAVPVAALNIVAPTQSSAKTAFSMPEAADYAPAVSMAAGAPDAAEAAEVAANTTAVASATATHTADGLATSLPQGFTARAANGAAIINEGGRTLLTSPNGSTIAIDAPGKDGRQRVTLRSANGSVVVYPDASMVPGLTRQTSQTPRTPRVAPVPATDADTLIGMKATGITPEYAASIRAAAPELRNVTGDGLMGMKALGVTPSYVRELAAAGYRDLNADSITGARAVGVSASYARELAQLGYRNVSVDDLTEMRAVGVTPAYIRKLRSAGYSSLSVDKLVEMRAVGAFIRDRDSDDGG